MPEEFSHKSEVLAGHCRDVGRDVDEIVRSANFNVVIGRDEREVQDRLGWIRAHYASAGLPEAVVESAVRSFADGPLVGTPEQLVEALRDLERRGMTYAITYFVEQAYDLTGVELFEREVIPAFVGREPHGNFWHFVHGE
jgi:alkanesulfonate monooxygenase SsuD/methylene tetrahydromethanopterin reductase-like flavin-dependent oxidoreductase (luciferase family)